MQKSKLQSMGRGDREHLERTSEELHQHRSLLCRLLVLRRRPFLCCCRRRPLPSVAFDGLCVGGLPSVSCRRAAVREVEAERREAQERERRAGDGRRTGLATPLRFLAVDFAADCRSDLPVLSRASRCPPVPLSRAETRYSRSGRRHYFPLPAVSPQRRALPRSSSRAIF